MLKNVSLALTPMASPPMTERVSTEERFVLYLIFNLDLVIHPRRELLRVDPSELEMQQRSLGYGHIPGCKVGTTWDSRLILSNCLAFLLRHVPTSE
jgi:hypothetical protein